jgi:hypothetical protein
MMEESRSGRPKDEDGGEKPINSIYMMATRARAVRRRR